MHIYGCLGIILSTTRQMYAQTELFLIVSHTVGDWPSERQASIAEFRPKTGGSLQGGDMLPSPTSARRRVEATAKEASASSAGSRRK